MNPRVKGVLKFGAMALLVLVTVKFVVVQSRAFRESGEAGTKVWFYDINAKRLYASSRNTVPPDAETKGGVRAVVVAFKLGEKDLAKLKVAYLETYSPELKEIFEGVQAAHAGKKVYDGPIPSRGSDFLETNTFVRQLDEPDWHTAKSAEGRKIMAEWRVWRGPAGERPLVSTP